MRRARALRKLMQSRLAEQLALYRQARCFRGEMTQVNLGRMPILLFYFTFMFGMNLIGNQWLGGSPIALREWIFYGITALFWVLYFACTLGTIKGETAKKYVYLGFWIASDLYLLVFIGMDILFAHTAYNYLLGMFIIAILPLLTPLQSLTAIAVDMAYALVLAGLSGYSDTLTQFLIGSSLFALIISMRGFFSFLRIQSVHRRLLEMSETDRLTGLYNRNILDSRVARLRRTCAQQNWSFAAAMVDIDCFKNYNDTFGHVLGDRCLEKVADCILKAAPDALAMRYGGEEFLIFFSNAAPAQVAQVLEDVQARIKALDLDAGDGAAYPKLTVSIGVAAAVPDPSASLDALINDADRRLYEAKEKGRNCICPAF